MYRQSVIEMTRRSWGFVLENQSDFIRKAALPGLAWLFLAVLLAAIPNIDESLPFLSVISNVILAVFLADWFRFTLRLGPAKSPAFDLLRNPMALLKVVGRIVLRIAVVVIVASVILLPLTILFAAGTLIATGNLDDPAALDRVVSLAMPLSALVMSPLLVRFYVYYAALAAGRNDLSARDIWRWSRGRSLRLLGLLALSLGPAVLTLYIVDHIASQGLVVIPVYVLALPVVFVSLAVLASTTARAMASLVVPPVKA